MSDRLSNARLAQAEERLRERGDVDIDRLPLGEVKGVMRDALTLAEQHLKRPGPAAPVKVKAGKRTLAEVVKETMAAKGLTVAQVAERIGTTRETVNRLANGTTTDPKWSVVCKLADALGVSVADLRA